MECGIDSPEEVFVTVSLILTLLRRRREEVFEIWPLPHNGLETVLECQLIDVRDLESLDEHVGNGLT